MTKRLLLISHCPSGPGEAGGEVMGLGDGVRLLVAAHYLRQAGWRVDFAGGARLLRLLRQPALRSVCSGSRLLALHDVAGMDLDVFDRVVFCDHPARCRRLFGATADARVERLWPDGRGAYKTFSQHLVSRLLDLFGLRQEAVADAVRRVGAAGGRIGLHYLVPPEWKGKSPPVGFWRQLAAVLEGQGYVVSWQQGGNGDLPAYLDWVQGVDLLVTPISLGLHVGMLFGKGLVVLQGPTWCEEVDWLPAEMVYRPGHCGRSPCFLRHCPVGSWCFAGLSHGRVAEMVETWWQGVSR